MRGQRRAAATSCRFECGRGVVESDRGSALAPVRLSCSATSLAADGCPIAVTPTSLALMVPGVPLLPCFTSLQTSLAIRQKRSQRSIKGQAVAMTWDEASRTSAPGIPPRDVHLALR